MRYSPKLLIIALASMPLVSNAEDVHSDVEFGYENGRLIYESGPIFEGDFGDTALGPDATDDPGFATGDAEQLFIGNDEIIGYRVVRPLLYHNGSTFATSNTSLFVKNDLTNVTIEVTESTFAGSDFIVQADGQGGGIDAHLDFSVPASAPVGAYGLYLQLETFDSQGDPTGVPASDPLVIVFNRGLEESVFEEVAEGAFASTIPEPAALSLLGLLVMGMIGRRAFENR